MKIATLEQGWSLLSAREKQRAMMMLGLVVFSALTSALMVGSIMPFLATLADPKRIRDVEALAWAYRAGGFQSDYGFLVALGLASLFIIVAANALQIIRMYVATKFTTMLMHSLSLRLLQVYLRHPYEYFLGINSSEIGTQILAETERVVQLLYRPAVEAIAGALTVAAIVTLLMWLNPLVATIAFIVSGGLYFVTYYFSRKAVHRFGHIRADANKNRFRIASEALAGVKDIKLLGREADYAANYAKPSFKMARAEATAIFLGTLPQYVMQIAAFGGMIVLTLILLDPTTSSNSQSMGEILPLLGVFAFGGQKLIPELAKIYVGITQLTYGATVIEAIHRDLAAECTLPPLLRLNVRPLGLSRELELRDVYYKYPNSEGNGLAGVSIRIRAGERIGVVGGSGAGKTTLADVIMLLLKPSGGEIIVDGKVLTDDNARAWQRSVGYVQQDIFLSDACIEENIALGVPAGEIDRGRVVEAAGLARLDDFVRQELPEGYNTMVGERGVRLSGGQKQRIGIARALYNDADLIVFDEATSALDNVTEREVMDSIEALPGNKTAIIIAHRLSTIKKCDRLIVMERGRVVGVGTWDELLASNATFRTLAAATVPVAGAG